MTTSLADKLLQVTSAEDEAQLQQLERIVGSLNPSECTSTEFVALLQVFERFPESDGFGIFWSIVHFLEACAGYEPLLLASVRRKPVEFNVLMVNRLLNAGTIEVEGQSLLALLESAATNGKATEGARRSAESFVKFQREGGASA